MTPIDEAVKQVLQFAKSIGQRVVADFNGFIIDSKNSHDKNLDLYWHYMGRPDMDINWEQRRYEIAKEILPMIYRIECGDFSIEKMAGVRPFQTKSPCIQRPLPTALPRKSIVLIVCSFLLKFFDKRVCVFHCKHCHFFDANQENGCITVKESTLGMNTGLKDKHGHEIYNGDILAHGANIIGHVVDGVRGYCFDVVYITPEGENSCPLFEVVTNFNDKLEIVGNIHDKENGGAV